MGRTTSELNTKGVTEPVLELGGQARQKARTIFQVVEGITDDVLSVNRALDAGAEVASTSHARVSSGKMGDKPTSLGKEQDIEGLLALKVFVPTSTSEAHSAPSGRALQHGHAMRTFDIVAEFLIGRDGECRRVNMCTCGPRPNGNPSMKSEEWVRELPPAQRVPFEDLVFRLDGNLYERHGLQRRA